jgi:serine/threonine-protein kinase
MLQTGATISGYRIESVIGSGGMGTVYEATQLSLERTVALKVLAGGLTGDEEFRARFRREAMLQAALEHQHIVPVYEAGESDDVLFIAMKLVRGSDLKRLSEDGTLEPGRALAILAQAASALDSAHEAGLVHRDVKPQNILVDDEDCAYLADFGLVKGAGDRSMTLTGRYVGSLDYTPPEVVRGEPVGAPADLYAFAAVLVEALTGEVAFPHDTEAALLYAHVSEEPPSVSARRPELPPALDPVVARGLAKRSEDRYRSATELVKAAQRALEAPATAVVPAAPVPVANGRARFGDTVVDPTVLRRAPVVVVPKERHIPWRTIGIAALLIAALAVTGYALGALTRPDEEKSGEVAAGPISLAFPDGKWRQATPPAVPGLLLEGAIGLESTDGDRPGTIVAGLAPEAQGAGLLPTGVKRQLRGTVRVGALRIGDLTALRYPQLPATQSPYRIDLTLVPVSNGAVAVECLTPRVLGADQKPADCDTVVSTLKLNGLRQLPLDGTSSYTQTVASIVTRLDGERLAGRRQLAISTRRIEESRAAHVLAAAFAGAAYRLNHVQPTPFARPSHAALYGALREAQRAYYALQLAASAGDGGAFKHASAVIARTERKVDASVARLQRLRLPN